MNKKKSKYANYTKEQLIAELEERKTKYGLVWDHQKTAEVFETASKNKFPMLNEIPTKEIKQDNKPHILIEGDNYHALSVLNYTHKGKIDVIYIDPPYNLGKEFIYNDKLVDKEDSYKHSKWLSFMKKRLKLAKKLLSKKGVIFISIDDNEQSQLRLLCNEIFGEENFNATLIWQKKNSPQNDSKTISANHDYILSFAHNISNYHYLLLPRTDEQLKKFKNPDNDVRGKWSAGDLSVKTYNKDYDFPIITPSGRNAYPPKGRCWMTSKQRVENLIEDKRIYFGKNGDGMPKVKQFLNEVKPGIVPISVLLSSEVGSNTTAFKKLKSMGIRFDNPKPVSLIIHLLKITTKNGIVLDFFAGSGTTGHAVLQLNKEDGGNRKFILCTNNENNICTKVCYPRLKKAIKGYKNLKGEKVKGLEGSLKYYKTIFVGSDGTDKNKLEIVQYATEMLCIRENCFEKVLEKKTWRIYRNDMQSMAILYDIDAIEPFCKYVLKQKQTFMLYYFTLDENPTMDDFVSVKQYIKLKPIPAGIINTYRRIFKIDRT